MAEAATDEQIAKCTEHYEPAPPGTISPGGRFTLALIERIRQEKARVRRLESANRAATSLLDDEPKRLAQRCVELETAGAGMLERIDELESFLPMDTVVELLRLEARIEAADALAEGWFRGADRRRMGELALAYRATAPKTEETTNG